MGHALEPEYIVDAKGRRRKVVLSVEAYEELLEDLHDLSVLAQRRDEPSESFEALEHRLKENGVL